MTALYVGLMSGTSMDGIDAALVDCYSTKPHLVATHSKPWPDSTRQQLAQAQQLDDEAVFGLHELDRALATHFAAATLELLTISGTRANEIIAIGSHGQTIRHRPDAVKPFSLQLGNGQHIAELTGIQTVYDFRRADIEAGGEGAPLASAFHNAVLRNRSENRCVANIGGIANTTFLAREDSLPVTGYDTGPGNNLMDGWIMRHKALPFDDNGDWARTGRPDAGLLARWKADKYFQLPPPKSTGFEYFNQRWLEKYNVDDLAVEDIQATLCELTASTIADAVHANTFKIDRVLVCGGGAHNSYGLERLQSCLGNIPLESTGMHGVPPDWVEAMAFAWLAQCFIENKPGNLPSVTGAGEAVVLGTLASPDI